MKPFQSILFVSFIFLASACTVQTDTSNKDIDSSSSSLWSTVAAMKASSASSKASVVATKQHSSASDAVQASSKMPGEWNTDLSPEQLSVLRDGGTERPFTSPLNDEHRKGTFVSADCDIPLFRSEQKFDSGTGWPSFWAPISPDAVVEIEDTAYGMTRVEIRSPCGGHLGHVFTDGPEPTGLRYCMNGLALKFIPDEGQ